MSEIDPLISFHNRTKQYLAAVSSGATSSPFGCSDFYPTPTVLAGRYEEDGNYEDPSSEDEQSAKRTSKKTPKASKQSNSQEVSPDSTQDQDSSSSDDEEDSEEELDFLEEDLVQPVLDHLTRRLKQGKLSIKNNNGPDGPKILATLQSKHNQQRDTMAKGVQHYKDENKQLKGMVKNLQDQLQDEQQAHEKTVTQRDKLQDLYSEALEKLKGKSMNSCPTPCFFLHCAHETCIFSNSTCKLQEQRTREPAELWTCIQCCQDHQENHLA